MQNILLIANPAAQSGRAANAARDAGAMLHAATGANVRLETTQRSHHAETLAQEAAHYDAVVTLGGDGVVHETINGLMRLPEELRPALGVIPAGTGNDYARSLDMPKNPARAIERIARNEARWVDLGQVNNTYFMETLSFGLDAAIAIETVERRKHTNKSGTALYAECGFNQIAHHLDAHAWTASFDGGVPVSSSSITFAVQVGPYYGGGFRICPDASIDNGRFDVCIAHPPLGRAKAAFIFVRAKNGKHTGFQCMEMRTCKKLHVEFEVTPPAQMDGEQIVARVYDVSILPHALRVL
ncbi:diacylglycerol kinase [Denitrobacterium detoxificans]|uniref:Lipid kinase, YegS/Rv2252/BmrU family n=2 Tax=Denitrobacterium detoxificans TaxID=79604 RepID=A0A172RW00_9ACTN|nr:diacylglycerol kinase family protein [Denitrobacterium detoxificans]ANE21911.1 diacylglycerol kinase [Denitrobacterium detoxificans]SEO45340.1 lipid kinase, YegS/Rv2252/BmrU family [Denitrobacterium detoxificans]